MNKINKLGMIFDHLSDELNITEQMLLKAETAYTLLGEHIKKANDEWNVAVYPQGSFELGTVIKPLDDNNEQYDVDLVVLVEKPIFEPKEIRDNVKDLLMTYGRYEGEIEDKKPCIRIQYSNSTQFHMDIACAKNLFSGDASIKIAKYDDEKNYYYDISNPKGYIEWFKKTMKYREILNERMVHSAQTEVQELSLSRMRSPLQKAVQILKRHRDVYFLNRPNSDKRPSSIIITTLCAYAYEDTYGTFEKNNVYLTVLNMLEQFPKYLERNSDGEYSLKNPTNEKENFLKKWNDDQTLVSAFNEWIKKAKKDIITNPEQFIESDQRNFRSMLIESFGNSAVEKALDSYGKTIAQMAENGELLYDMENGDITANTATGREYNKHTYFGGNNEK